MSPVLLFGERPPVAKREPTFETYLDEKHIFAKDRETGRTFPVRIVTATVVITTAFGDTVTFRKCNRGAWFHDSRERETVPPSEVFYELNRLLIDPTRARQAFKMLNV